MLVRRLSLALAILAAVATHIAVMIAGAQQGQARQNETSRASTIGVADTSTVINRYCVTCHNQRLNTAGLAFDRLDVNNVGADPQTWEKVVRKVRAGVMPPSGSPRPDERTYAAFLAGIETALDRRAAEKPNAGRTETFHRLNRAEYQNAIRDLLDVDIDATKLLPADDATYGFDNVAGGLRLSESLIERYLAAARTISQRAIGASPSSPAGTTYLVTPETQQHEQVEGLPFGTRGGLLVQHPFLQDAEYAIRAELSGTAGIAEAHQLEITVDGEQVKVFDVPQPEGLEVRVPVRAGQRSVAATFFRRPAKLVEDLREPFQNPELEGNPGGPGGAAPFVSSLTITGPFAPAGAGNTPSRRRVFICRPANASEESGCAATILSNLARRAYRRPVTRDEVTVLTEFYDQGRAEGAGFDASIERALRRLLVSPEFLFRVELDPPQPGSAVSYRLSDLALASRLSFFLWSSIPDNDLLEAAEKGELSTPSVLTHQVKRMLADKRSEALTKNFAGQWLQLRNFEGLRPGDPYSLTFDDTLKQGLRRETELFFDSVVRGDRGVLELLTANYTFLNERVAQHYGIPYVYGSHFRRVTLSDDSARRGLLGHGSILTLTSHSIRTSPVLRGKFILEVLLGTPPPAPPPNVPPLPERPAGAQPLSMRERMAAHRANPVCASCHNMIDPLGFALEHFDAIGQWRDFDDSRTPVDATGNLPDGTKFDGSSQLRAALVRYPDRFATTVTERLLTYALGRGLDYYDMPTVRAIVRDAAIDNYRFHAVILGIVNSQPFTMRAARGSASTASVAAALEPRPAQRSRSNN